MTTMRASPRWLGVAVVVCIAVAACTDNPNIDGSKVAKSASTCAGVCNRLVSLCGYAPEGDDCTDADGGGYCDTQMDGYLDCFATAPSCQEAWNCFNTVTLPDDDAATGDASDDASAE